jgi:Gas vesicle synthesis protein GvpO
MAERRVARRRRVADEPDDELEQDDRAEELPEQDDFMEDEDEDEDRGPGRAHGLSAARAARAGLRQIAELTGKKPEGVTGVEPADNGWLVGVEVVEDRRIPSSADILAIYQADVDSEGELASYHRVRRYSRGRGDGSEES